LDDQIASALKAQADQFLRADIKRSLQTAGLLYHVAELTGNSAHRALGLLAEANARSIGLGQYQQGIELYDEAADIFRARGQLVEQAQSQVGKIGSLINLSRYQEALDTGRWAARILEAHTPSRPLATLTMNMAVAYGLQGKDAEALDMFDRAGEHFQQLGEQGESGWLWVQHNRAVTLRNLGRFDESIETSLRVRDRLAELGQTIDAARTQQNLALTYFILGRYNEALDNLDQVGAVFQRDGRRRDAMLVELYISDCLLQLRRFGDVLDKCRHVRELFAELGARHIVADAIVNEAVAYAQLERYAEALASLAEARGIFEEEANPVKVASCDLETAAVLLRQGRPQESLATAQACAAVFGRHSLAVEEAQAILVAARAALALEHHEQGRSMATAALNTGRERNVPTLTYQGHQLLGALAAAQKDLPAALTEYEQAIQELERLRGRLMIEFRVGFLEDKEVIYEDVVGLCLHLGQPLHGLEYAERAKSRALLDLLAQRLNLRVEARDETDRPLVEQLIQMRAERDRLYRRWESDGESSERGWSSSTSGRQQAQQDVLTLEKQITDLWHRLLVRNADYARDAMLWTVRTEPIQPYLPPDTLLVEYFVVHHQFVAFLVTRTDVQSVKLPGDIAQVQQLMQRLWLNLGAVPRSTPNQIVHLDINARSLLRQLHAKLIEPLSETLSHYSRLIIVPHGPLHYLPFHALHDGETYLLERQTLSHLPSASFLRYCSEAQPAHSGTLAVGHSNGGHLPHAVTEAQAVAALMDGQACLEDEATLARIQQAAPECRLIHLAAHGDFRPDNPLFSGLAIADGWLTTLDIFNLRLKASLVTLSACQTGRNVVGGGDELLGLMRAFLSAGAASLALSLWAVEDRSTAQLMEAFYRNLTRGLSKGEALRDAQLQFIRPRDGSGDAVAETHKHPYFWAPFFLVGDAGRL
jgi:CHAT domain-containing protein